jgi:hypothetical protein
LMIGRRDDSMKTASWSPMPGIDLTVLISVLLLVKKRSKVDAVYSVILVGNSTTWSKWASPTMLSSSAETVDWIACCFTAWVVQSTSGRFSWVYM